MRKKLVVITLKTVEKQQSFKDNKRRFFSINV